MEMGGADKGKKSAAPAEKAGAASFIFSTLLKYQFGEIIVAPVGQGYEVNAFCKCTKVYEVAFIAGSY